MIETPRLFLLPVDASHYEAMLLGKELLAAVLGVEIPEPWTEFPEAILVSYDKIKSDPSLVGWLYYFFIHREQRTLIGTGGYKGRVDPAGTLEIGFEIITPQREKGYGTEAAQALIRNAFGFREVQQIHAHTLPEFNASVSVLRKCGLQFVRAEHESQDAEVWLWEINRILYGEGYSLHYSLPQSRMTFPASGPPESFISVSVK